MTNKIIQNHATGHLNPTLYKKIERKLIRHVGCKKFYIGKTGREPALRFQEHPLNFVYVIIGRYHEVVLVQTPYD